MSNVYQKFASVYDRFMDNIPYQEWSNYLYQLFCQYQISTGNLVELGCGTGTLCQLMSQHNFHITGIDLSKDMIKQAKKKKADRITYMTGNMCKLQLDDTKTYDGFYSLCDSMNYLLYDEEVISTLKGVNYYLKPNGIFIFDLKTEYFYQNRLGNQIFLDQQKDCSYIWENQYFKEDLVNQYDLTLFVKSGFLPFYRRYTETHHQKAYPLPKMIDFIRQAGLEYVTAYDAFTTNIPTPESERIYIITRNGEQK